MTARSLVATLPEAIEELEFWTELEGNFANVSMRAWNAVIQQVFKVFLLARVTLKSFRQLPDAAALIGEMQPEVLCVGSNVYSVAESVLLAWMSVLYAKEFPGKSARVTNFDKDLASGVVLFAVLVAYWPALNRRRKDLRLEPLTNQHYQDNADLIVQSLEEMGLPYVIKVEDIMSPDPCEAMVFVLYLYQTLPQFMPRTTIEFLGKLGETMTKDLELTNPSKKAISYVARLEGHRDFSIDASILRIDPGGTVRFPVRCTPSNSMNQEARLVLMSRKDGGAHAATLVFLMQSKVNTRSPLRRVRTEGPLYELQVFDFTVTNPFPVDCDFTITLEHVPVVPIPKKEPVDNGKANDRRRTSGRANGRNSMDKEAQPVIEAPKHKIWPDAFGLERSRIRLKTQSNDKLKVMFLPFLTGTHQATVVFRDKEQGEFCYELVGEAGLPAPGLEVKGSLPFDNPSQPYELNLTYQNAQLEQARRIFLDRHPLAKEKDQALLVRTDLFKTELVYAVSQTNSLITCPAVVTLSPSGNFDKSDLSSRGGNRGRPADRLSSPPLPGMPGEGSQGNMLLMSLKPIGTGVYPTRVMLTSHLDIRIVDLELSAQVMTQKFQLEFDGACRQAMSQSVPIVNASDAVMPVKATIEGSAFSGARDLNIQPNMTQDYMLTFKPTSLGDHRGSLELLMTNTGERLIYTLLGRATEPVADGHLVFECQARKSVARSVAVPNIMGAQVEYQVMCDLDYVSGPAVMRLSASATGTYKITAWPLRSGVYFGTLTFMAPDGQFVWYSIEVRASEPPEMGVIQVSSQVRQAVVVSIPLVNPLPNDLTLRVQYGHPALVGPATVTLPAGMRPTSAQSASAAADNTTPFECFFAPLTVGDAIESLAFVSEEVGEYVYQVEMHATPAPAETLSELLVELGRSTAHKVTVENPTDSPAVVTASVSGAGAFVVEPNQAVLPPLTSKEFAINYFPACLGEVEEASVSLSSAEVGTYEYRVSGRGELPLQMELTTVVARIGSVAQAPLTWRNPFPEPVGVSISLQPSAATPSGTFELLRHSGNGPNGGKPVMVPNGGSLLIPVGFKTRTMQLWTATVLVEMPPSKFCRDTLTWRYPLTGLAESADSNTVFKYRCRARASTEELMEIQLAGLASVSEGDLFTHELVIPPESRALLDSSALFVTTVDTHITAPDQALRYRLTFAPRCSLNASVEFIVFKSTGGRWRFEIQLQATEPEVDGTITVEANMGQTSSVSVPIYSSTNEPEPYTAVLTPDTPLNFNVYPAKGLLYPRNSHLYVPIQVAYTCRELGKVLQGRLHIHTGSGTQHGYDLRGAIPTYVPPTPADMPVSVDDRLAPSLAAKLGKVSEKKNYVSSNTKTGTLRR